MKLEILTVKEFTDWAINNEEITFHQTKEWADLKKRNGWNFEVPAISFYKFYELIQGRSIILAVNIPLSYVKSHPPPVFSTMWRTD